ncbi:MAG TPA: hypothetical protein VFX97_01600 [Pyrinomonadaceae bacterium]|nr:hypothetical protein [Pyrinomonadaceae bacterium]
MFDKTRLQKPVVDRILSISDFKVAPPNDGYLITAALLAEGAISSVVTLNFDVALTTALSQLGLGSVVGVIERPEDLQLPHTKLVNVYYLHRNANSPDPELWVLRTSVLEEDWRNHWEALIAVRVLTAPVVVFAGLGTPIAVLLESSRLIREALPMPTVVYQVGPGARVGSRFALEAGVDAQHYIQLGWGEFMTELAKRLTVEFRSKLDQSLREKTEEEQLPAENSGDLVNQIMNLDFVTQGILRAHVLLASKPYEPASDDAFRLIGDLLLAIAMIARISASSAVILKNGMVEFRRDHRTVARYILASGRGHRGRAAVEAQLRSRRQRVDEMEANGVLVAGTSEPIELPTLPKDIARGDIPFDDLIAPDTPMYHVSVIRSAPETIGDIVP